MPDVTLSHSGRQFADWLGLTPKTHGSGGKERRIGISKQDDGYLQRLLLSARPLSSGSLDRTTPPGPGQRSCLGARSRKSSRSSWPNNTARITWAVLAHKQMYVAPLAWPPPLQLKSQGACGGVETSSQTGRIGIERTRVMIPTEVAP